MWEIGQREDGNSTALCHGNWGCTTLKLMLAEFWRHRAHFKKKNVGCSPAPLANYRPAASSTTTPKKVPSLAFLCICDVLCTVSSYPPWFFLHVAAIMIIFCTTLFFLVSRWRQRNWLKKRLRSKGNTSWYVVLFFHFLLHVAYLFILRLCLHYDLEVA